ncbi:NADH-quinone oxidoreductase subunit A [Desulfovermiculus halophilus]|jgi:NADH-quinone oxidoreductase subunit A|uniref:NADH-quinone oxidoreductase subunit A n=1 Tax=Desulfovermiculus halophilus TaxID=339722 RepID=UPI000480313E|nr:NADH-quinone oxidoreductase subunit A [Desulfovermiculus halophilus]
MLLEYIPLAYLILIAVSFGLVTVLLSSLLGPRRQTAVKDASYECGLPSEGIQYTQTPIKFYVVALLFLIFDLECVFLYPWAVHLGSLGLAGFFGVLVFIGILLVCFVYEWKSGALEWD